MRKYVFRRFLGVEKILSIMMMGFFSQASWSQSYNITNFHDKKATSQQFIKALKLDPVQPIQNPGGGTLFRTLKIIPKNKTASMELNFELNSYQLTNSAKEILGELGPALQSQELTDYKFMVEGHTDSRGIDEYNLSLSRKRASAVKQYLVSNFGIDPKRLAAVGRGEKSLLDKENPENAINRRVQIVNIQ